MCCTSQCFLLLLLGIVPVSITTEMFHSIPYMASTIEIHERTKITPNR